MTTDYAGLWQLIGYVRSDPALWHNTRSPDDERDLRRVSLALVGELLDQGLAEIGAANRDGSFSPWDVSTEEAIKRIEQAWIDLGRLPNIGDGAWFRLADNGRALLRQEVDEP